MNGAWDQVWWGNTVADYVMAAGIFVGLAMVFMVIQRLALARLRWLAKRTETDIDDTFIKLVAQIRPPVYLTIALWLAVRTLSLTPLLRQIVDGVAITVVVYQVVVTLQVLIDYIVRRRLRQTQAEEEAETGADQRNLESALSVVHKVSSAILWSLGILFVLSNFGINVTSLIAGLGIGGIAVALAAQNVLGDLFSSLAIYLDKPFAVGDFIIVGDVMGTVKYIGIKTTRIKSLSGEEIILSNQDLTSARIKNYKRMEERRVVFEVGVAYETAQEKVERVPTLLQKSVEQTDHTRFDRAHFKSFGDSALIFEMIYYVTDKNYTVYMDAQQAINLKIMKAFREEGIAIAYPTRTVYMHSA